MNFDNIVGNPPFKELANNGRQTNKSIWKDFLIKASQISEKGGYIAMVHPMGWAAPSDNGKLNDKFFTKMNLMWADVRTKLKTHFNGVGSTFSVTITKNEPYSGKTVIVDDDGETTIDFRITRMVTSNGMSIMKKITDISGKCTFKLAGKGDMYSGNGHHPNLVPDTAKFKNIHQVNSAKDYEPGTTIPIRYSEEVSPLHGIPKVVIPYNGPANIIVDDGSYGVGWCQFMTLDASEIEGAKSVFGSKLFKFFVGKKHTQYNETKNLNLFPKLDLSKTWTDVSLYKFFGLTKEEINFIESNIK